MGDFEKLISEIIALPSEKLVANAERVKRIVANLEVDEEEYNRLLVGEVVDSVYVEAQIVASQRCGGHSTPEDVKAKALSLLERKLERDERLYARG